MSISLTKDQATNADLIAAFKNDPSWTFVRPGETARVEFRGYRGDRASRFSDDADHRWFRGVVADSTPLVGLVPKERPVTCFACDWMHPIGEDCPGTVR